MTDPRYTPLRERHEALGASFTDFGGWQMPVRYTSDLAEHHAVRESAGIFDISHMAEFTVRGAGAAAFLDHALAGRLSALAEGKAKYSLLLAEDVERALYDYPGAVVAASHDRMLRSRWAGERLALSSQKTP